MSLNLQHQIRQNALEIQDYLRDLHEWESKANTEVNRPKEVKPVSQDPPVRGVCAPSLLPPIPSSLKRDTTSVETYYDAWDKFDVAS